MLGVRVSRLACCLLACLLLLGRLKFCWESQWSACVCTAVQWAVTTCYMTRSGADNEPDRSCGVPQGIACEGWKQQLSAPQAYRLDHAQPQLSTLAARDSCWRKFCSHHGPYEALVAARPDKVDIASDGVSGNFDKIRDHYSDTGAACNHKDL